MPSGVRVRTKTTELGLEKECPRCREFWPVDDEFYFRVGKDHWESFCIACYLEAYRPERLAARAAA